MTILAGYVAGQDRAVLDLAAQIARSLGQPLTSVTVIPAPWPTPMPQGVDAEYAQWADEEGARACTEASQYLGEVAADVEHSTVAVSGRSIAAAVLWAIEHHDANMIVLGSSRDGGLGQVVIGSTAARLLHSSPVPVALAPRGYHPTVGSRISRVTCAFSPTEGSAAVLAATAELAKPAGLPLRVATFGVRGRTMFTAGIGLGAEDQVLDVWMKQAEAAQQAAVRTLAAHGIVPADTPAEVGRGDGWTEALDQVRWQENEILVVGSSALGPIARVFLGSHAHKIVRHSPVPVVVAPVSAAANATSSAVSHAVADAAAEASAGAVRNGPSG